MAIRGRRSAPTSAPTPTFPKQTNVEFVRVVSPTEIEFRIYERGVGPTHSSGTGTCASATAAIALRNCARSLSATSIGGPQQIEWPADDQPILLTGPACIVCTGEATLDPPWMPADPGGAA